MKAIFAVGVVLALTGCCSYSQLNREVSAVRVNGCEPLASYEVINVSYKLLGVLPITTGVTWKNGPYTEDAGSMRMFADEASLDDNLASVKHACEIVGSDEIRAVTARVDDYRGWSLGLISKRVVKTSCVIVR